MRKSAIINTLSALSIGVGLRTGFSEFSQTNFYTRIFANPLRLFSLTYYCKLCQYLLHDNHTPIITLHLWPHRPTVCLNDVCPSIPLCITTI